MLGRSRPASRPHAPQLHDLGHFCEANNVVSYAGSAKGSTCEVYAIFFSVLNHFLPLLNRTLFESRTCIFYIPAALSWETGRYPLESRVTVCVHECWLTWHLSSANTCLKLNNRPTGAASILAATSDYRPNTQAMIGHRLVVTMDYANVPITFYHSRGGGDFSYRL